MNINRKKITISTVIVCFFVSVIAFAAVTLFPNAKISFTGIKMVSNGATTQGFVDINLKNIDTTALSFCLEYDKDYVELSDFATNVPVENKTSTPTFGTKYNTEYKYFKQNTDDFPGENFISQIDWSIVMVHAPIIGVADAENGRVLMNFTPDIDNTNPSEHIVVKQLKGGVADENEETVLCADGKSLKLGTLSFNIKDPAKFAKLTKAELKNVIKIVPFSTMTTFDNEDVTDDNGVHIGYIDENEDISWYSRADKNIECDFEITAELTNVKAMRESAAVTSYEIYKQGDKQDLLDYLNSQMSVIILEYADGSQSTSVFKWDIASLTMTYDPKGGKYEITQKYNDDFDVTVTVDVTAVKLIGFDVENQSITYYTDDANYPQTMDDLKLPQTARPILDTYIPNGGIPQLEIGWYQLDGENGGFTDIPDNIKNKVVGSYKILAHLSGNDYSLQTDFPWLTVDNISDIEIMRYVTDNASEVPKSLDVVSAATADDGTVTIVVKNTDGSQIPANTEFTIKMPGGETVNTSNYTVVINADGTATITMTADINEPSEKKLAELINLGDRVGGAFAIASTEPGCNIGPYTEFTLNPRKNIYTANAEFDYSKGSAAAFPVKTVASAADIPKTITLPFASDYIATTYNGYTGDEIGMLNTFTVDSWDVLSGDPTVEGSVVEIKGVLATTSYTNYGEVKNENNNTVTIKYLVVNGDDRDTIDTIPDFVYDMQQVGYDYDKLQTNSFTVKNIGATDIYGLKAEISLSKDNSKEAFVVTKPLPSILKNGDSVDFDITTKYGLDVGKYECTVSIISDDGVLGTFKITFEVTEEPTYKIDIKLDTEDLGSAKTDNGTYTAKEAETITIVAEPKTDCVFVGWTSSSGDVVFADSTASTTTFTMPSSDVEITAHFKESLAAKLRATELIVKDIDDKAQDLCDDTWKKVTFDPAKREYYVAVENDTEKVKLWFKLRTEAENATLSLTHDHGTTDTLNVPAKDSDDQYYKSDEITLDVSPTDNLLTLTMKYNDPNDDPDEGEVTAEYKIHIYRKIEQSSLMVFNYGNSPYGEIMRDGGIAEADKQTAKDEFVNNKYTFTQGYTPTNCTVGTTYSPLAWSKTNYDLDDGALFVINSDTFEDSGYQSLTNSIGEPVTNGVTKKVTVNVLSEPNASYKNGSADDYAAIVQKTINLAASGTVAELQSERIRPDVYELVYSFTDFDGSTMSIKRPLIVLNKIGDVNNDKTTDVTDVVLIKTRFSVGLANNVNVKDYEVGGLLNKYRICDVNKDGAFNLIDANAVRKGNAVEFYSNLGGGA